jgi:hypothetical protein
MREPLHVAREFMRGLFYFLDDSRGSLSVKFLQILERPWFEFNFINHRSQIISAAQAAIALTAATFATTNPWLHENRAMSLNHHSRVFVEAEQVRIWWFCWPYPYPLSTLSIFAFMIFIVSSQTLDVLYGRRSYNRPE